MKDNMDILCQFEERAIKDIKKLLVKDDITPAEWNTAGEAVDIIKDIATIKAMKEEYPDEDMGESARYYRRGNGMGNSYGMYPDYDSYGVRSMGGRRGSSYGGSSYGAEMNSAANNIRNLMNQSTNENERNMYARWLDEAERMNR